MSEHNETLVEIVAELRSLEKCAEHSIHPRDDLPTVFGKPIMVYFADLANRIEATAKRDADSIERLVRDAIIDYQEMFAHAPNDDAERELVERAKRGNAWLVAHGYEPEKTIWDKEEPPCL